ncbi:unnamed protein product [Macrosiphum euphorbiae]|uniref:Uncharacterized protein n=1 Tax=Macrosiphum euphorbiae TaxID=13131 RepID=A0AAV0WET5_9HEMI|nr:unnamed protein product [Macrosiphum euphorbiae]
MLAWDDHDFRVRFRLGKNVVRNLLEYIEDEIASQTISLLVPACLIVHDVSVAIVYGHVIVSSRILFLEEDSPHALFVVLDVRMVLTPAGRLPLAFDCRGRQLRTGVPTLYYITLFSLSMYN